MKLRIFNIVFIVLAVVGFVIVMGGVGTMDFMVESGVDYPLINSIKTVGIGMLMMIPSGVKEIVEWLKKDRIL
ncbi:hypothetical protein J6O48_02950 [bacterium]|nr:hypothetical protein [bacterium]